MTEIPPLKMVSDEVVQRALTWWVDFYVRNEIECHNPKAIGYTRQYRRAVREVAVKHEAVLEGIVAEYMIRKEGGTLKEPLWPGIKPQAEKALQRANHG